MNGTPHPPPLYMKHFSTDLRKFQEGSEQKFEGLDPPIPPVATPLVNINTPPRSPLYFQRPKWEYRQATQIDIHYCSSIEGRTYSTSFEWCSRLHLANDANWFDRMVLLRRTIEEWTYLSTRLHLANDAKCLLTLKSYRRLSRVRIGGL